MGWLDQVVAVLIAGVGAVLAAIVAFHGGSAIQVGLVVLLFGAATLRWLNTSVRLCREDRDKA